MEMVIGYKGMHGFLLPAPSTSHHFYLFKFRNVRGKKSPFEKVAKKAVSSKFN